MLSELRDFLRSFADLAGLASVRLVGEAGAISTPARVVLQKVADPRTHDLDGDTNQRAARVQCDIYAPTDAAAEKILARLEEILAEEIAGSFLGARQVLEAEIVNDFQADVTEASPKGGAGATVRRIVEVRILF